MNECKKADMIICPQKRNYYVCIFNIYTYFPSKNKPEVLLFTHTTLIWIQIIFVITTNTCIHIILYTSGWHMIKNYHLIIDNYHFSTQMKVCKAMLSLNLLNSLKIGWLQLINKCLEKLMLEPSGQVRLLRTVNNWGQCKDS